MAGSAKKATRAKVEAVPDPEPASSSHVDTADAADTPGTAHTPAACPVAWCPVCLAVTAVQPVNPEMVEHLLKAGTEFFLALRSLIDVRADGIAPGADDEPGDGFQKIDIG
jgi:hypothetical protein